MNVRDLRCLVRPNDVTEKCVREELKRIVSPWKIYKTQNTDCFQMISSPISRYSSARPTDGVLCQLHRKRVLYVEFSSAYSKPLLCEECLIDTLTYQSSPNYTKTNVKLLDSVLSEATLQSKQQELKPCEVCHSENP